MTIAVPIRLRNRPWRLKAAQQGVETVEALITLGLFLFIVFAVIDGSRMILDYHLVAHAARQGSRYAAVRGTEASRDARRAGDAPTDADGVRNYVRSVTPLSPIDVDTTWTNDSLNPGQIVTVRVDYDFEPTTPLLKLFKGRTLSSTSSMVIYF
jgi:Flp pilus assembly protein TadG